jgi:uncharacterized protein
MRLPLSGYPDFVIWQPFLDEIITHPAPDAFRAAHNFRCTIEIPGFHVTTWFDIFQTSVLAAFNDIQSRVGNQKLWIGPNEHHFVYHRNFWQYDPYFAWFDHWLKREPTGIMPSAGRPRQRGHNGSICAVTAVSADGPGGPARGYRYDPRRPIPTSGGRNMLIDAGPRDQRPVQALADYGLIYCGEALGEDLTIAGEVRVTPSVQSTCPDSDFVAKLIDLHPDGSAMLLMDGVIHAMYRDPSGEPHQLAPDRVERLTINLGHICHTFGAGHQIEVDVASSNFPRPQHQQRPSGAGE